MGTLFSDQDSGGPCLHAPHREGSPYELGAADESEPGKTGC